MTSRTYQQVVEAWHLEWLNSTTPHWGDKMDWTTADEIARRLDETEKPAPESCDLAPEGWYCVRQKGHPGGCRQYLNP